MVAKGEGEGVELMGSLGFVDANNAREWISNEVLCYSAGNSIPFLGIDHEGGEYERKNVYICMIRSLCCTVEIDTKLQHHCNVNNQKKFLSVTHNLVTLKQFSFLLSPCTVSPFLTALLCKELHTWQCVQFKETGCRQMPV